MIGMAGQKRPRLTPHRRAYPVNLDDLPFHVESEFEDGSGETWLVNASGTATFNCGIEVRANLLGAVDLEVAHMPLIGPVADLWLVVETYEMVRRRLLVRGS